MTVCRNARYRYHALGAVRARGPERPDGERSGRTHVGGLVRQAAMRRIAGEDGETEEMPFAVQLDEGTPRLSDVPRQAAAIAAEAERLLDD